jgi:2-polyprenyl-3-methyl-5-hydroxy-6-metoxy-1,4-benzoquinol methylase
MSLELGAYWEQRAIRYGRVDRGLPAVCSYGMPRLYNEAIHACQRRALAPLIAQWHDLDILEAGCGIGRWSVELAKRGNRVVGLDVSQTMVALARDNARQAHVDCDFRVGSVVSHRFDRRFDVVFAVTVLQHVLDDGEFDAAIRNLASHLAPGGVLALLEVAPTRLTSRCDSAIFRARPLSTHRAALAGSGLEIVSVGGVDAQALRTLSLAAMRTLPPKVARALVATAAFVASPLDFVVGRLFPNASWHKVIVAKSAG